MTGKVIKLSKKKKISPQKKIIEDLRTKYPRVERNCQYTQIHPEDEVNYDFELYGGKNLFVVTKTLEDEGYMKVSDIPIFEKFYRPPVEHILYRSLKLVYGNPDRLIISSCMMCNDIEEIEEEWQDTEEWSYLLKLDESFYIEIKRGENPILPSCIMWIHEERYHELETKSDSYAIGEKALEFIVLLNDLVNIVDNNYSIKDEIKRVENEKVGLSLRYVTNLYFAYLRSGNEILEIAENLVKKEEETSLGVVHLVQWGKILEKIRNIGTLYMSATIFFLMALEGFINIIYKFLLKPELEYSQFRRSIRANGLELKILNLPNYCSGFSNSKITPDDDAVKNWQLIRAFRNNLLHANLDREHEMLLFEEDGVIFHYNILFHRKYHHKVRNHTDPSLFRENDTLKVKNAVEGIVINIIEKMDSEEKCWVNSWIDKGLIEPFQQK